MEQDYLEKGIVEAVKKRIQSAADEELIEASRRLRDRIPDIVSKLALDITSSVSIQRMNTQFIVKFDMSDWDKDELEKKLRRR